MENAYIENDLDNPKYLFAGSPYLLEYLEPRKAKDENHNPLNEDKSIKVIFKYRDSYNECLNLLKGEVLNNE